MPRTRRDALPDSTQFDQLAEAVVRLADEVKVIRQILDAILDEFKWALNNDRLGLPPDSPAAQRADRREAAFTDRVEHFTDEEPSDQIPAVNHAGKQPLGEFWQH